MARILKEFPLFKRPGHLKYPWEQWADGHIWEITKGEDYTITPEGMRSTILAKARGTFHLHVSTRILRDKQHPQVIFQFYKETPGDLLKK